jgi:hypothetical protein
MTVTINGTTGITTPDLTSADDITANGSTVLTAATSPAALPLAGGTLTGNVNLGDNVKAIFGAGSDLQIYHDASNSFIVENGEGNLRLKANNLLLTDNSDANYLVGLSGAQVTLYHNNLNKLATSATGVTVTGNVDTSGTILVGNTNSVFAENNLRFNSGGASYIDHTTVGQAINFRVSNASSLDTTAMTISSSGVISGNGSGLTGVSPPTTAGAVGTYTRGRPANATNFAFGDTSSGIYPWEEISTFPIYYDTSSGTPFKGSGAVGSIQSGTWRCMSMAAGVIDKGYMGLWVRIS